MKPVCYTIFDDFIIFGFYSQGKYVTISFFPHLFLSSSVMAHFHLWINSAVARNIMWYSQSDLNKVRFWCIDLKSFGSKWFCLEAHFSEQHPCFSMMWSGNHSFQLLLWCKSPVQISLKLTANLYYPQIYDSISHVCFTSPVLLGWQSFFSWPTQGTKSNHSNPGLPHWLFLNSSLYF